MMTTLKKSILTFALVLFSFTTLMAESAKVLYVNGKVEVNRNNSWIPLKVGDAVAVNETISTGFKSEAKISLYDSVMVLGALTRVTLDSLYKTADKDNVSVYLNTGAVRSKVNHTNTKRVAYSVTSPVATASARGTDFTVTASGNMSCSEGSIAVYPNYDKSRKASTVGSGAAKSEKQESQEVSESSETSDRKENPNQSAGSGQTADSAKSQAWTNQPGTIMVGKNQAITMSPTNRNETPMAHVMKQNNSVAGAMQTPADKESVVMGVGSPVTPTPVESIDKATPEPLPVELDPTPVDPTPTPDPVESASASISASITIED